MKSILVHTVSMFNFLNSDFYVSLVSHESRELAHEMMTEEVEQLIKDNPSYSHFTPTVGGAGYHIFENNKIVWRFKLQSQMTI